MQNNTLKINTILLAVLVIVLIAFMGWKLSTGMQKKDPYGQSIKNSPVSIGVTWDELMVKGRVQSLIKSKIPAPLVKEDKMYIKEVQTDVTGDGKAEVLVYYGFTVENASELIILTLNNLNQPQVVKSRDKNGVFKEIFSIIDGTVAGSEFNYGLISDQNIIYQMKKEIQSQICSIDAYKWNRENESFEYSSLDSENLQQRYCLNN